MYLSVQSWKNIIASNYGIIRGEQPELTAQLTLVENPSAHIEDDYSACN